MSYFPKNCCIENKGKFRGWSDSTMGRILVLHEIDPGLIPSTPYGLLNLS